ncbi:hypothetical protein OHR68_29935 [Spirillospora sp. NBC_00431]
MTASTVDDRHSPRVYMVAAGAWSATSFKVVDGGVQVRKCFPAVTIRSSHPQRRTYARRGTDACIAAPSAAGITSSPHHHEWVIAVWRRQAARAFDDLVNDIESGAWPQPTCPAEEMALHLMLQDAPAADADDWAELEESPSALPEHPDDLDWSMAGEVLLQDYDLRSVDLPVRVVCRVCQMGHMNLTDVGEG